MAGPRMTTEQYSEYLTKTNRQAASMPVPAKQATPTKVAKSWMITPAPAPRQVPRDKFKPSPGVQRYRAFRDEVALRKVWHPEPGDLVVFIMPIPKSRQRDELEGHPHLQTPDADNLLKALLDACYGNDAHIWTITPAKVWGRAGAIYIERRPPALATPFVLGGSQ